MNAEDRLRNKVRRISDPYVLVRHKGTNRTFILNGAYNILEKPVSDEDIEILWAMAMNEWDGWKPTLRSQNPDWAWEIPDEEFIARWLTK